ncbi:hypothetical protein [Armatimonas sp.]|uniref:hypothetical protein n=1 Tax=Armatimonas sp. TaxID=1872638 RepID=UPI003751DDBC
MNLDDRAKSWHADARLSKSMCVRLSQAAPSAKPHPGALALRYGVAVCVGISLGLGLVASRRPAITSKEESQKASPLFDNATFLRVAATIKHWREPDPTPPLKAGSRWEAILFTDLECAACWKVYPLLKRAESLRVGICHFPLTKIHPNAWQRAMQAEIKATSHEFWDFVTTPSAKAESF